MFPEQHRGAVTTSPGAAGERAGGLALPWLLLGAERPKARVTSAHHLSAVPDLDTPGQTLPPTVTLEGTEPWHVQPWPRCPGTAGPLMTARCGTGPQEMPVCSHRIALVHHTCPWYPNCCWQELGKHYFCPSAVFSQATNLNDLLAQSVLSPVPKSKEPQR